jgi:four helix bundle protein
MKAEREKRAGNIQHPIAGSNLQHPTSNIEHPMADSQTPRSTGESTTAGAEGSECWELREGEVGKRKFDLEERLLEFASAVIDLSKKLPNSRSGNHIAGQLLRAGTSPYPNHGEAEEAESRDDFIHKLKICLKELRETLRWARLVRRKAWAREDATLAFVLAEADELVRIFYSSIQTAKRNALAEKRPSPRHDHYQPPTTG